MSQHAGLGKYNIVGFITIVDVGRAKEFYRDTLGLRLVSEEPPFALVFEANGIMLRLGMGKELPAARGTVLGWEVPDVAAAVGDLERAGVRFERYEFMKQDEFGYMDHSHRLKSSLVQGSGRKYSERFGTSGVQKVNSVCAIEAATARYYFVYRSPSPSTAGSCPMEDRA